MAVIWGFLVQGVILDLRTQLKTSIASHETMQSHSAALTDLQHQMHDMAKPQQELMRQAGDIGSLKSQLDASAERHRRLTFQVWSHSQSFRLHTEP